MNAADNQTLKGDEFVEVFQGYTDTNAPSGKVLGGAITIARPDDGIKQLTYTIRLKSLGVTGASTTVGDPYFVGDSRLATDNSGRRDRNLDGTPLRTALGATVNTNPSRGTVTGKVTDAKTGNAIFGAAISFKVVGFDAYESWGRTTDMQGVYSLPVIANALEVRAGASNYIAQTQNVLVQENGTATADFKLVGM